MFITMILFLAGSVSVIGVLVMMLFLAVLARENELPDLDDIQV